MLYTVIEVREVHVYAWLDMYPGTVIVYIIIVYNLVMRACLCV